MNTIFLIIIFILLGVAFGFIMGRGASAISNYFLRKKITKDAIEEDKKFFFKEQPYSLKEQIEYEQSKRKKGFLSGIFEKKMKGGISDYGNTTNAGNIRESVFNGNSGIPTSNPILASPPTSPGEQKYTNPPENRGIRTNFNRNLFEKGK